MSQTLRTIDERCSAVRAGQSAIEALAGALHEATGPELAALVILFDTVSAQAAAARTATVAEAERRGETTGTLTGWVREHAPSLRQGGAQQTARLATAAVAATSGGPDWSGAVAAPDPQSPLGLVWAASTDSAAAADASLADPGGTDSVIEADPARADSVAGCAPWRPPLSPALGLAVLAEVRHLEPRLRPEVVPTVTEVLIELAREWGPAHMRSFRARLLAEYGAEGELADLHDKLARAAYLSSPSVESSELTEYRMALTPEQAATLEATIGPLSAPAPNPDTGERDLRPAGQRRIEALTEVCRSAMSAAADGQGTDGAAGSWAALHLTMSLEHLQGVTGCRPAAAGSSLSVSAGVAPAGAGEALLSPAQGTLISPEHLRRIACEADLIPHVLGSKGEELDLGRSVRLFNRGQRRALMRRDRHCTYPGCDRPAAWTRAHHVLHWLDGGATDLDNAALLCERHHTTVHARRMWAQVSATPDVDGRTVHWDLHDGSYDRELERRRAERSQHDPPPLTPARLAMLTTSLQQVDTNESRWASEQLAWYDEWLAESAPHRDPGVIVEVA